MPRFIIAMLYRPGEGWTASITHGESAKFMLRGCDRLWTWGIEASSYIVAFQLGAALFGYRGDG